MFAQGSLRCAGITSRKFLFGPKALNPESYIVSPESSFRVSWEPRNLTAPKPSPAARLLGDILQAPARQRGGSDAGGFTLTLKVHVPKWGVLGP